MALDEFGHEGRKSLRLPLAIAVLDDDIVPFHVPQLVQTLSEGLDPGRIRNKRASVEKTDPGHSLRRLLGGGERHPEDAEGEQDYEPDRVVPHADRLLLALCLPCPGTVREPDRCLPSSSSRTPGLRRRR